MDVLVSAVRFAKKLLKTAPYSQSKPVFYDPPEDIIDDDERLRDWVRNRYAPARILCSCDVR